MKKYFNNSKESFDSVKKKAIAMNLFYPHLKYEVINELQKTTIIDLLASIGGTLGLFLGMSILHVIKITEKIVQMLLKRKPQL